MIDNTTGRATRINLQPLRLDMVLLTGLRDRQLLMGWLLAQMTEAAKRLWPEFNQPKPERKPMVRYPIKSRRAARPEVPFLPRWRRRMADPDEDYDDDGGI